MTYSACSPALAVFLLLAGQAAAQSTPGTDAVDRELAVVNALRPTEAPALVLQVEKGKNLLTAKVTYVYSGVLRSEIDERFGFGIGKTGRSIPAGTPVFGFPVDHPTGVEPRPELLWCAVVISSRGPAQVWNTTCLPKHGPWYNFVPAGRAYFPSALAIGNLATAPEIEEKAVDLSPILTVYIQFAGWDNNLANLRLTVHQPPHMDFGLTPNVNPDTFIGKPHLPLDSTGAAHLQVFGGELTIRRAPDGKSAVVEQTRPFSP